MAPAHDHEHHPHPGAHADTAGKAHTIQGPHHHDKAGLCCTHHELQELQSERYLLIYFTGAVLLAATFLSKHLFPGAIAGPIAEVPAIAAALLLGFPLFYASVKELRAGYASSSSLASLALIGLLAVGRYEPAGWVAFILLVADQVLRRTAFSAQRVIEQLIRLTPDVARTLRDGHESEVSLAQVKVGDVVRVRPGENLPIDGVIIAGRSTLDQASLTGEAQPHEVAPGDEVYAGTTNLSTTLDIRATKVGTDTTIGKVSQLISAAERAKTPRQLLIEQVARFYVPVVLSIAALTWFVSGGAASGPSREDAVLRAVSVLFVACPSALLISSPTAMVAAFAAAARLGILIKQTRYLEAAADIDTVVMDKTGTITTGKFAVARLAPAPGVDPALLLASAANAEQQSNHPLARSIIATASAARIHLDGSTDHQEIHGRGVRARTSSGELFVGRASWIAELLPHAQHDIAAASAKAEGMTGVHVASGDRYLGCVGLEDRVRPNTKPVIDRLRDLGVRRVSIFTGDRLSVAQRVGLAVGADSVEAECLPAEKHEQVLALASQGRRVLMVGDGINDGPSLAAADVGVAMGLSGSDIATNSAGVALMNDDLSRVPFLIELSRMARAIISQNIAISIIVALVGLVLAATGYVEVFGALVFHFVGDVIVVLNSFRLFRFGELYAENDSALTDPASAPARRAASLNLAAASADPAANSPQPQPA